VSIGSQSTSDGVAVRAGRERSERAVTIIELMVVVLVIGALLAVAIPVFNGARGRASDSVAKSTIKIGHEAATVLMVDTADFSGVNPGSMAAVEGSISYRSGPSPDPLTLSVRANQNWFRGAVRSDTGLCFYVYARPNQPTLYGSRERNRCRAQHARFFATSTTW